MSTSMLLSNPPPILPKDPSQRYLNISTNIPTGPKLQTPPNWNTTERWNSVHYNHLKPNNPQKKPEIMKTPKESSKPHTNIGPSLSLQLSGEPWIIWNFVCAHQSISTQNPEIAKPHHLHPNILPNPNTSPRVLVPLMHKTPKPEVSWHLPTHPRNSQVQNRKTSLHPPKFTIHPKANPNIRTTKIRNCLCPKSAIKSQTRKLYMKHYKFPTQLPPPPQTPISRPLHVQKSQEIRSLVHTNLKHLTLHHPLKHSENT